MSWLYRPTPVVKMGRGDFASQNVAPGFNGGTMRGVLHGWNYATGARQVRAAKTSRQPWIKTSGTMGEFIPNGLGGFGDDPTYIDPGDTLTPPDFTPFDTSTLLNPATLISMPAFQVTNSVLPNMLTPPAGAGPTGNGIPGTQPLNAAALVGPSASILSSIGNFFKPSTPKAVAPTSYAALPGYGGAAPSWFSQATILPATPNYQVLLFGVAGVLLLTGLFSGSKAGYRR